MTTKPCDHSVEFRHACLAKRLGVSVTVVIEDRLGFCDCACHEEAE